MTDPDTDLHILPVGDLIEHDGKGHDCVCGPDLERKNGRTLLIHHSLDGREATENGLYTVRPEDGPQ